MDRAISFAESGKLSDSLIRAGIREGSRRRLQSLRKSFDTDPGGALQSFLNELKNLPIADFTKEANEQHYELPPEFFQLVLGQQLKYSCCYFPTMSESLDEGETLALSQVTERAQLAEGQRILELGCGWGSLSLRMASQFPCSTIVAVSNSNPQRLYIEGEAARRGITNLKVITADINAFEPEGQFDRIVSVEMLEHVRNYDALFGRVSHWLKQDGKFFVHVFRHHAYPYLFDTEGAANWMGRYFFSGGVMPSCQLLAQAQSHLKLSNSWELDGRHYERTANLWLENLDARTAEVLTVLERAYGKEQAQVWLQRWRIFFMSCAELFGYRQGQEWGVSHLLFEQPTG
ncbi:MAG: class I SAM-dependent methyltransferase [Armatimonadetes bacterium]|nr:class I SAM-dependent methyltransferase [Armatimonadota bacterium]